MKRPHFGIERWIIPLLSVALMGSGCSAPAPSGPGETGSANDAKPVASATAAPPFELPAQNGTIRITPIFHASLQIEFQNRVIQVDPFSKGDYSRAKKADLILITHVHGDHFDKAAIAEVSKSDVSIIAPPSVASQLKNLPNAKVAALTDDASMNASMMVLPNYKPAGIVTAVPAYNLKRGPKAGQKYHPQGEGNGYVLNLGGKRIYIAGDTEFVPEMKQLKNIDVAFLPMNLPFTMTPAEAADAVKSFQPKIAVPYHYRYPFDQPNSNAEEFTRLLKNSKIQVRVFDWYGR